jgi:hypothetical protein
VGHTKQQGAHIGDRGEDIHPRVLEEAVLRHDDRLVSLEVAKGYEEDLEYKDKHARCKFQVS